MALVSRAFAPLLYQKDQSTQSGANVLAFWLNPSRDFKPRDLRGPGLRATFFVVDELVKLFTLLLLGFALHRETGEEPAIRVIGLGWCCFETTQPSR